MPANHSNDERTLLIEMNPFARRASRAPSLLLVRCPLPGERDATLLKWVQCSANGQEVHGEGIAPLSLLPAQQELVLLLPASALSWHQVTLPPGSLQSPARLRRVLEGLLEDRLLDDPAHLHFALATGARPGRAVWIAVCSRDWLRKVLAMATEAGRRVSRMVPEFTPMAEGTPRAVWITGTADDPYLTICSVTGVMNVPLTAATATLCMAKDGSPAEDSGTVNRSDDGTTESSARTLIYAEPLVEGVAAQLVCQPATIVHPATRWLRAYRSDWNVGQLEFATTGTAHTRKRIGLAIDFIWTAPEWRAARWAVLVLVLLQIAGLNAWALKERRDLDATRRLIEQTVIDTFPNVTVVVDAPVQMAREVAALKAAAGAIGPNDFEPMLGALGRHLPAERMPSAFDYSGGQLRVRGTSLSPAELESFTARMDRQGYAVRLEGELLVVQARTQAGR